MSSTFIKNDDVLPLQIMLWKCFFFKYTVFYFIQQENAGRRILPFSLNS